MVKSGCTLPVILRQSSETVVAIAGREGLLSKDGGDKVECLRTATKDASVVRRALGHCHLVKT